MLPSLKKKERGREVSALASLARSLFQCLILSLLFAAFGHIPSQILRLALENLEAAKQILVDGQYCTRVIKLVHVVWSREDGHQPPLCEELVTLSHHLVGSHNQVHVVLFHESFHNFLPEDVAHSPVALRPSNHLIRRIGPQEVAKHAIVWDFARPSDRLYLRHATKLGRETTMNAKDLIPNYGRKGQAIENLGERPEHFGVVLLLYLVVEPIDPRYAAALVVATNHEEFPWVLELVAQEQEHHLEAARASVDVVAQKQVIRFWRVAVILKYSKQVFILPVDVPDDLEGGIEAKQRWLSTKGFRKGRKKMTVRRRRKYTGVGKETLHLLEENCDG